MQVSLYVQVIENILIGKKAGVCSKTGNNNIFLGSYAVSNRAHTGERNIAIGKNAGFLALSGSCNILLGNCVANNNTVTGDNNIYMGYLTKLFW